MKLKIEAIFLDDLGNIRSGWRILIFTLLLLAAASIVFFLASVFTADLVFYAPLLLLISIFIATVMMVVVFEKRPLHSVGVPFHRRMPVEIGQGILIGAVMMSVVFLLQYGAGWIEIEWKGLDSGAVMGMMAYALFVFAFAGFGEELLFRGYPFQTLVESIKTPVAVIIMSLVFSFAHMMNPNMTLLGFFNIFLAGIWLSVAYLKTRTLWLPTGLHVSWNFFQGTIFSYPVSGQLIDDRSLFSTTATGPAFLTGGEFGPEGGLIATVVLIIGTVYIYKSKNIIIGEGVWTVERYIREELERFSK